MEFQSYMFVQIAFFIGVLLFLYKEMTVAQKLSDRTERKQFYLLQFILFIGVFVRLFNLSYPDGVFIDGAQGAFDSWCLANFGIDSNLASYPVYLKSWGTGQSALYAYFALPFIKVFGLSAEAYRLPMSLIGCFTLLFFYWTLRKTQKNKLLVFCLAAFLAINPWHIIKCRFAVDCNIFPDLLFIGICFIILACYSTFSRKQSLFYIIGFGIISFSAYGYAVSWFALPFLYLLMLWYLFKAKKIDKSTGIISVVTSFLIVVPLLLFVYVLFFDGDQFQIGKMTITKLSTGRHESTTLLGAENVLSAFLKNIKDMGRLLIFGVDNMSTSTLPVYGEFYNVISLPFLAFGIYRHWKLKDKEPVFVIFFIWLVSCFLVVLLVAPNVNHWNILWFPITAFTAYGIHLFAEKSKENQILFFSIYSIIFAVFLYTYFDKRIYNPFNSYTFKDEIIFSQEQNLDKVYYPRDMQHPFILFYKPVAPLQFATTLDRDSITLRYKSYDNVILGLPEHIEPKPKTGYLIPNDLLKYIDLSQFKIKRGKYYYSFIWND
ncbi:hypothetical protein CLV62_103102 [Dysgonomonas alginatilytica]|uniref:Dolichyl-phosphate-mannose-protein mannosyltransferase n=1 Tax=Dysgonomonas alginatilytica TaxID=1605892 RepID=A0A2V3PRV7_9BACT|nr:hypothetical protein [Dysgonomonas alginatilytica]PXV67429.1 hypothetical protein CLV62_103102 [Dysgonomonas alginatilytica]